MSLYGLKTGFAVTSFGVLCRHSQKHCATIRNVHIYADGEGLNFLRICADFLVFEFLQTYAKKLCVSIRNLRIYANGERLEFLRICANFCLGVSVDVRKKAPNLS